jgi:hypothetical protein
MLNFFLFSLFHPPLSASSAGRACTLQGTWRRLEAGSAEAIFGRFYCRRQPPSASTHIGICGVCDGVIQPGDTRWVCAVCPLWFCCARCQSREEARHHPHVLMPETMFALPIAAGIDELVFMLLI